MGMMFVLSPARHIKTAAIDIACTEPLFAKDTKIILEKLKGYSLWELESILKTNANIAMKAFVNIQDFYSSEVFALQKPDSPPDFLPVPIGTVTPAMFAYDGLVYKHLDPLSLNKQAVEYAQSTMRIVSAFYGLLRPFDGIRPYRLEMQSKLRIENKNLYDFWDDKIYHSLFEKGNCIFNLASEEYAKTIRKHLKPWDMFIDIVFYSIVKGRKKVNTTIAKMARGQMARFILENGIDDPKPLKDFEWDGFRYVKSLSDSTRYVFM